MLLNYMIIGLTNITLIYNMHFFLGMHPTYIVLTAHLLL